ncbi:hypothetical protein V9T40_009817, partial [Parthenolecanium corni]
TPPNPREYPYSPGVSATYVSKTKVERNLCRGRKQPRSAYALSRSSTAAGDDDIFTHLALARTPLSRRADERRAIYPADRSGSRSTIDRERCTRLRRRRPESSSVRDVPSRACFVVVVVRRARMHVERERARVFGVVSVSDERTVSRKSTSLPGSADVRVCTHTRTLVKKVTRPGGRVDSSESRARRSSPFVGGGLEGALSAAPCSTERRPVADRVSHESTSVLWLILPVVICLSQRLSHACLNRTHVTWITVVILELIHADRAPTSASSFGGSPVVVGRSEGALLLDQNRPSVSTAFGARRATGDVSFKCLPYQLSTVGSTPTVVVTAPIAYIKVVAVKKLVVGSVSSRRRTTERGRSGFAPRVPPGDRSRRVSGTSCRQADTRRRRRPRSLGASVDRGALRRARPVVPSLASRARHFGNATAVKILSASSSRHRFGVARACGAGGPARLL